MEQGLKERLVGAAVLVILAVIFIPMLLNNQRSSTDISGSNIPPIPEDMPVITEDSGFTAPLITNEVQSDADADITAETESSADSVQKKSSSKIQTKPDPETVKDTETTIREKVGVSAWVIQVGSFASKSNADDLNSDLRKAGFRSFIEPLEKSGKTSYRVRIGPELKRSDAEATRDRVKKEFKLEGILLRYP
jgi:DedD protein